MPVLYFAAPLFSIAERGFNRSLSAALIERIPSLDIILPQDQTPPSGVDRMQ